MRAAPDAQLNDVKALLGRMLFTGKSVQKKARTWGPCLKEFCVRSVARVCRRCRAACRSQTSWATRRRVLILRSARLFVRPKEPRCA